MASVDVSPFISTCWEFEIFLGVCKGVSSIILQVSPLVEFHLVGAQLYRLSLDARTVALKPVMGK